MYGNRNSRGRSRSRPPRHRSRDGKQSTENYGFDQDDQDDDCGDRDFSSSPSGRRGRTQYFQGRRNSTRISQRRRGKQNYYDRDAAVVEYPGWEEDEPDNGFMTEPPLGPMCSDETIFSKFVASVTFLTKPVSAKWMSQTRNGVLPKIAKDLIQAMEGYAGRLNKIQFMNCLLAEQESYGRSGYRSAQPVKLIMLFVRLYEVICAMLPDGMTMEEFLQTVPDFREDVEKLKSRFNSVFNNTLKHVKKNPHNAAKDHLNILNSLRLECNEIGLQIMELEDDQIPQEAYVSRNDSVSGNTSRTIVSSEKNVIDKVTLVPSPSVSPIVGFQYLGNKLTQEVYQSIQHYHSNVTSITPVDEYEEVSESDFKEFEAYLRGKEDYLDVFRRKRKLLIQSFKSNPVEFKNLVTNLVDSFVKGHMVGRFRVDQFFFEILFCQKYLNNAGRKAIMWTVAEIFATKAPRNLYRTEAEHLLKIIEDFKVSECDPKWDTIELLAIRNRFRMYLPSIFLSPIDCLIPRMIVKKYKLIKLFNVGLNLEHFYPPKASVLQLIANEILEEIPEITDFVQSCKELQNMHYSLANQVRAPSPSIICLGPAVKPIPDVVTLD